MKEIRGHHLFCMALFTGHGYDEAFATNMASVIRDLKAGESFRPVSGHDAVCAACPNRRPEGGCALGTEDVQARDEAAFRVLGLQAGVTLTWQQAKNGLQNITEAEFQNVCGGCRWAGEGLCSQRLLQKLLA